MKPLLSSSLTKLSFIQVIKLENSTPLATQGFLELNFSPFARYQRHAIM